MEKQYRSLEMLAKAKQRIEDKAVRDRELAIHELNTVCNSTESFLLPLLKEDIEVYEMGREIKEFNSHQVCDACNLWARYDSDGSALVGFVLNCEKDDYSHYDGYSVMMHIDGKVKVKIYGTSVGYRPICENLANRTAKQVIALAKSVQKLRNTYEIFHDKLADYVVKFCSEH